MNPLRSWRAAATVAIACGGCIGAIGSGSAEGESANPNAPTANARGPGAVSGPPTPPAANPAGLLGLAVEARSLTAYEYANSIDYLLQEKPLKSETDLFPGGGSLFGAADDDQAPSAGPFVLAARSVAEAVSARALASTTRRDRIVGCGPAGATDPRCMETFVRSFGRRALRRPLRPDEVTFLVSSALKEAAEPASGFYKGVELVMRTLLEDMEFLYRVEIGTEEKPGLLKLTPHEIASRLAFLLWGRPPQDAPDAPSVALPKIADEGRLSNRDEILGAAKAMLGSSWYKTQVLRFHTLWLQLASLAPADKTETDALLEQVLVKEKGTRSWLDLFRGTGSAKGLISQRAILSTSLQGHAYPDNSEIFRGKYMQSTFLCTDVKQLPPAELMKIIDSLKKAPPNADGASCKRDVAASTRLVPGTVCSGCHGLMDNVGFAFENFDGEGRFHASEPNGCAIAPNGEAIGVGTFRGPEGLAQLLIDKQIVDECGVKQLFRFAMGRRETDGTDSADPALLKTLSGTFRRTNHSLDQVLLELVGSDGFRYRRLEGEAR